MNRKILKKEYGIIWLIVSIIAEGIPVYFLAYLLDIYKKDAWYANITNWVIGFIFFIFPAIIMLIIFSIQITVETAKKLKLPGWDIYCNPYIWILGVIIPFLGWIGITILGLYVTFGSYIMLMQGKGEKYI